MIWTVLSHTAVFLLGGLITTALTLWIIRKRVATAVILAQESEKLIEQMVKNQEFLTSMVIQDQRAYNLIKTNQRLLKTVEQDIEEKIESYFRG